MKSKFTVSQLVGTAILVAVVIILQFVASGIKVGPFNITLTLVPIIIGAILYGPASGAILGAVFGLYVCGTVVAGLDAGGAILFSINPFTTLLIVMLKSTLAGYFSGLVARSLAGSNLQLGVVLAAIVAPITNTGIFVLGLALCFGNVLTQWAAGSSSVTSYVITGLVGVNFLLELIINIVLVPIVIRIIRAAKLVRNTENI